MGAKKRAKDKGRDYSLSAKIVGQMWRAQDYRCFYTKIEMLPYHPNIKRNPYAASIDRIDSSKGYTPDNCVLCLYVVNRMKSDMPLDEFLSICHSISKENHHG